jgi:hypothetical protein
MRQLGSIEEGYAYADFRDESLFIDLVQKPKTIHVLLELPAEATAISVGIQICGDIVKPQLALS